MAFCHLSTKKARSELESAERRLTQAKVALVKAQERVDQCENEVRSAKHEMNLNEDLDARPPGFRESSQA